MAYSPPMWMPAGSTVVVDRYTIPGGMIYVGSVPSDRYDSNELPECIDPTLPVDNWNPDYAGQAMDFWPAYHSIPPGCRSAYLQWLASGKNAPNAYIGYVFLYFYGLERRVLVDARANLAAAQMELRQIFAEVTRLLRIYGSNDSFRSYATDFCDLLNLLLVQRQRVCDGPPPDPAGADRWSPPLSLRLGIGEFAQDGQPLPVSWAYSWAMLNPEINPRTPAERCPEEFRRLFTLRYQEKYRDGMSVRPLKRTITAEYNPASAAFDYTEIRIPTSVPDVLTAAVPTRALAELVESCTNDLDSYSRLLGRNPDAAGTVAAAAVLPAELLDPALPALQPVRAFLESHRVAVEPAVVDGRALASLWPERIPGKFGKADAVALAQLLERLNVGVEPDVRMGGPVLGAGPVVLFSDTQALPTAASPEYAAATTLLHLAAVVSSADDEVSEVERAHLVDHLESALHLSAGERARLTAHLTWLLASDLKLTGLKKQLAILSIPQRRSVADFLTTVAAIDGHISPGEVKTLRKVYTLLELDPESVTTKLHQAVVQPASSPVIVREAAPGPAGYTIPKPPKEKSGDALALDHALIEAKLAETAAVSALLADLFADEDEQLVVRPVPVLSDVALVEGLDGPHSALARRVSERPSWSRAELEQLCDELGLMVEGALDTVNEAAVDVAGEPLIEDDGDDYCLNEYARGELLV
jgi:tellurite resistance protein